MKKSQKQIVLEEKILSVLDGKTKTAAEFIFQDEEIGIIQNYANNVSITRLGYNDHGPVHMRKAALNAIIMFDLLAEAGIKCSLEKEDVGTKEDSKIAVLIASLLHDLGMSLTRERHEISSAILSVNIVDRILKELYPENFTKRVILRSLILEGILGHMATVKINSIEAGLVLVGDGCDMEKGRARIPQMISEKPRVGDIHRHSSMAIHRMRILNGNEKPIKIDVTMSQSVGFFQIEEVLFPKIKMSPIMPYIELYAGVRDKEKLKYL